MRRKVATAKGASSSPFGKRLAKCQRGGNLTVADLARWFDRPHATLRTWLNGRSPGGGPIDQDHAEALLVTLEMLISKRHGFPVPRMAPRARIEHLQKVRTAIVG